jgi:hypothetical protein
MPTYSHATNSYLNPRHELKDCSEGAILANTWRERYGTPRIDTVEKKLCFALLQSAVMNVAQAAFHGGKHRRENQGATQKQRQALRAAAEDREWFEDRDRWDPWSFNYIFSTLFPEWDLERARRSILEHPELIRERIETMARVDEEVSEEIEN